MNVLWWIPSGEKRTFQACTSLCKEGFLDSERHIGMQDILKNTNEIKIVEESRVKEALW